MANYTQVIYGGIELNITSVTPVKHQKTKKTIIGKELVEANVIGLSAQQWELQLSGMVLGTTTDNLGTNRATIEAFDDATTRALVDGIHDGTYYVRPGTLSFSDSGDNAGTHYKYTMTVVEQ